MEEMLEMEGLNFLEMVKLPSPESYAWPTLMVTLALEYRKNVERVPCTCFLFSQLCIFKRVL